MPTIRIEQTGAPQDGAFPANLRFDDRAHPTFRPYYPRYQRGRWGGHPRPEERP